MSRTTKRTPARHSKRRPIHNPVGDAIIRAGKSIFNRDFQKARNEADSLCIASDCTKSVEYAVGFFYYVIRRAMQLDQWVIVESDAEKELSAVPSVLMEIQATSQLTSAQRKTLMDGMDYLVALSEVLSIEARAVAWEHVSRVTGIKR